MNRKSSVCWLRPLLGTASTSLLICSLSVPVQAEVPEIHAIESTPPDAEQSIALAESAESISDSTPIAVKTTDLAAIESKEIPAIISIAAEPSAQSNAEVITSAPIQAEPEVDVSNAAIVPESVQADPVQAEAVQADLIQPDSVQADSVQAIASEVESPVSPEVTTPQAIQPDEAIQPSLTVSQRSNEPQPEPTSSQASDLVGEPLVRAQGAIVVQGDETSARARLTGIYAISPNVLFGTTLDLTTGNAFVDSESDGFNINELYVAASPEGSPGLRFVAGMVDLTSYFDRNSFAKDGVTHFFNPVFQTNPALAATGIGSRPSALVIWQVNDAIEVKAATFSSSRDLSEFALDGFAGEVGVRLGDVIVRGTFSSDRDAGQDDGFREIFSFDRGGNFGLESNDREQAYGVNAEWWIPNLNLGLFGRYGHYENLELDRGGDTYSFGLNLLDLFMPDDRLGLGYGRQLSNNALRQDEGANLPDVLELFYDARISPNLRAGVSLQQRDAFSETVLGFRIRADFDLLGGR